MNAPPEPPADWRYDHAESPLLPPVGAIPLPGAPQASQEAARRTRAQLILVGLLIMAMVAGGLLFVVGGGTGAEAAVSDAVARSAADGSAAVTLSGTVAVAGRSVAVSGSGVVDLGSQSAQLTLSSRTAGHQTTEKAIFVDGTGYLYFPTLSSLVPGKTWISMDLSTLMGTDGAGDLSSETNPASWLPLLTQQGNQVTALGPSTVGGTPVQGYSVTIDKSTIDAHISSANVPSWLRSVLSEITFNSIDAKVYVDGSGLLRRVTVSTQETVGSSEVVEIQEATTYSNYNAPVTISAPPPSEVITFEQALHSPDAVGGLGTLR